MYRYVLALLAAIVFVGPALSPAQAQEAKRGLSPVLGDVFRWQNNFHYSLVVKTEVGVVVVDPISEGSAAALKVELDKHFNQPVIALIYSHSYGDHASGGRALDAAMAIAHKNAAADIDGVVPDIRFSERLTTTLGGKSEAELTETVTMDDYKNWAAYGNWRALNVQGMARYLRQTGKAN